MIKTQPIEAMKLKHGNGTGFYCGNRFVGLVKEHHNIKAKFVIVCPFKRVPEMFVTVKDGKERLFKEFKHFMEGVFNQQIELIEKS